MALTKAMLKAMDISDEKIEQIISAHRDTINGLTEARDSYKADAEKYKADAEKLKTVEKDLVKAQANLEAEQEKVSELQKTKAEFESYKADVEAKETVNKKQIAYRKLLSKAGVSEKRFDSILRITSVDDIELDDKGDIKDSDKIVENIKSEWADFIVKKSEQGAEVPAGNEGGATSTFDKMSLAEKMAYANSHPDSDDVKAWLK